LRTQNVHDIHIKFHENLSTESNVARLQNKHTHQRLILAFLKTGLINLLCVAGRFDKMWSARGQHQIQYTE